MPDFKTDRFQAVLWAHTLLNQEDWCILDTETTGLGYKDQICSIGVLAPDGSTLFDTLVCPTVPVSPDAERIHGLSKEMLADAPAFPDVFLQLWKAVGRRNLVIYNAEFDTRMIQQSLVAHGLLWQISGSDRTVVPAIGGISRIDQWCRSWLSGAAVHCAMEWFAQFCGEWNDYHYSYRWQKLPGGDHTALGDCRAVLKLMQRMAAEYEPEAKLPEPAEPEFKPVSGANLVEMPQVGTGVEENQYDDIPF